MKITVGGAQFTGEFICPSRLSRVSFLGHHEVLGCSCGAHRPELQVRRIRPNQAVGSLRLVGGACQPARAPEARVSNAQCWRGPRHHFDEFINDQVGAQAAPPPFLRLVENGPSLDFDF